MSSTPGPVQPADVTVVIPARDRAGVLGRALTSVHAQTLPPAAVVVVDDGSSDDTAETARRAGAVVLSHPESRGSGEARNTGIRWAQTRWIALLDSDDEWTPDHLETSMRAAPGHALVTSVMVDDFGRARGNTSGAARIITHDMLFFPENIVCTSTVVADREAVMTAGLFRSLGRAQDLELWVRLLKQGTGYAMTHQGACYHIPDAYTAPDLRARSRAGRDAVLEAYRDEPWMTRRLQQDIASQGHWDDFRHAHHRGDRGAAGAALARLVTSPRALPAMIATVRHRRRGRTGPSSAAPRPAGTTSSDA